MRLKRSLALAHSLVLMAALNACAEESDADSNESGSVDDENGSDEKSEDPSPDSNNSESNSPNETASEPESGDDESEESSEDTAQESSEESEEGEEGGESESGEEGSADGQRQFEVRVENIAPAFDYSASGVFTTPVGSDGPGPLLPGHHYSFEFAAGPGSKLSFVSMFVPSNDLFFAPDGSGIALFDGEGNQLEGDVTSQIQVWDAGTEENQELGNGADQPLNQAGPNTGDADSNSSIREATGASLPSVEDVLQVTLSALPNNHFRLEIHNVSDGETLSHSAGKMAVPVTPGVWVVHSNNDPLFSEGEEDRGEGLEAIAEDGNPATLHASVDGRTGVGGPLAPGVWVVHQDDEVIFQAGEPALDNGLEALAEDGNPGILAESLAESGYEEARGVFSTPDGAEEPGPLLPGHSYTFMVDASPGDRLSLATMVVQSNDRFFAFSEDGIELFDEAEEPIGGDLSEYLLLWDAGTEVDQVPGAGPDQPIRQAGPDSGDADSNTTVRVVHDLGLYPEDFVRITVEAVEE